MRIVATKVVQGKGSPRSEGSPSELMPPRSFRSAAQESRQEQMLGGAWQSHHEPRQSVGGSRRSLGEAMAGTPTELARHRDPDGRGRHGRSKNSGGRAMGGPLDKARWIEVAARTFKTKVLGLEKRAEGRPDWMAMRSRHWDGKWGVGLGARNRCHQGGRPARHAVRSVHPAKWPSLAADRAGHSGAGRHHQDFARPCNGTRTRVGAFGGIHPRGIRRQALGDNEDPHGTERRVK